MQDKELYRYLLGLEPPWTVERVDLNVGDQRVDVWASHEEGLRWPCPECGAMLPIYDHTAERVWRHLDSCQFKTFLHARPPRVDCKKHGVRQVRLAWAEEKARFTALFERLAIEVMRACDILSAARILRISWDEAWHIMERAVSRGLKSKRRRAKRIGVDEKTAGQGHDYVTVVNDLEKATVEYVSDGRRKESLDSYFNLLSEKARQKIETIAVDIWDPYLASIREHVPQWEEKVVFDRYHLMAHMIKAVDEVRKVEHRALKKVGDETLSGSKYLWLYSKENLPEKHKSRFQTLKGMHLKTARAWAIKESFRDLWGYKRLGWAIRHFRAWFFWATHSRLKPVIEKARMFHKYLMQILTYFRHRVTNAISEGINSKIETIRKKAYGFRNREHFKIAIYFHCGGLNLYPVTHKKVG
jgi:transposase